MQSRKLDELTEDLTVYFKGLYFYYTPTIHFLIHIQ